MKQKLGELTPNTYNTYLDSRGRMIIPDYKNKRAYILQKQDEKQYNILSNRFSVGLAITMLAGFYWSWVWGIVVGLAAFGLMEYMYRFKFLPGLQTVENVEFPPKKTVASAAAGLTPKRRIILLLMLILFAVLLVVNMVMSVKDWNNVIHFTDMNDVILVVFTLGIACFALYMATQVFSAMVGKKDE